MGAVAATGVTLWEGDIHLFPPGNVTGPAMGLLQSVMAVLPAQTGGTPFWAFQPDKENSIEQSKALSVLPLSLSGSFPTLRSLPFLHPRMLSPAHTKPTWGFSLVPGSVCPAVGCCQQSQQSKL